MSRKVYFPAAYAIRAVTAVLLFTIGLLIYVYAQGGVSRAIHVY
jgi:hypothetical protein